MSTAPSLRDLYASHAGKVSDKWSLYLDVYDAAFGRFRDRPIAFAEIGVQNGGSLELWARYFARAEIVLGCDVDPKCGALAFDDPRIAVVVGNVNNDATYRAILARAPLFDVFIDDGSHTSKDIIATFCNYFRHVKAGGIYAIEDLHCSYLKRWGGGADRSDTSMEFLKRLADWVNERWWQAEREPGSLLDPFFPASARPDVAPFRSIRSVTFVDSMCLVEKRAPGEGPGIGARVIVGSEATVSSAPLDIRKAR
jgi:hypothetical protein